MLCFLTLPFPRSSARVRYKRRASASCAFSPSE